MASLAFAFSLRVTRARPERDPERASEPRPLSSLQAPGRCIHSWPEWTPERDGVGPYLRLGTGLARAGFRAWLLWSFPAPLCGICARPERDPKPVCRRGPGKTSSVFVGLRVKSEDGASSGLWTCLFLAGKAFTRAQLSAAIMRLRLDGT